MAFLGTKKSKEVQLEERAEKDGLGEIGEIKLVESDE